MRRRAAGREDSIADAIQVAEGKLQVRDGLSDVIRRFAVAHEDAGVFVTTNWDQAVDRALRQVDPRYEAHHLHGRAHFGSELYLPTEVADEPHRDEARRSELTLLHGALKDAVDRCTKLVIYGLSLWPLDVEVSQMLASGGYQSPTFREVVIVDPNHKLVASRLLTVLSTKGRRIEIVGYDPQDTRASAGIDYSLSAASSPNADA